jgi:Chaperone of endosialidase
MTTKSVWFGARRGTGLAEEILRAKSLEDARGVDFNTANGNAALFSNTTGNGNIALGVAAGRNLTTGNNNIDIGNLGVAGESNTIRIGWVGVQNAAFIAGIRGAVVPGGVGVVAGLNGHLGTVVSSARFKEAIKPMDEASEAILALKPVTFRYKRELDPEGIPQFGLVAEEVEKVNPDLVVRDGQGRVNSVRYEAVNAMLLNEFLKEHRKVQEVEAALARQQKDFAQQINALAASLKEQALQIQTLSSQHEAGKPVTSTAAGGGDFASKIPGGG